MRITPVQADVNVGADYPARGIPAQAFQSGYAQAGIEIARGSEDIGRLLQQKTHEDDQAAALHMQSQAELALQQDDAARKAVATDGPKYYQERRQAITDVIQQVGSTAKTPGAKRVFEAHMARAIVPIHGHALNHAAKLTGDAEIAQLTTTIDNNRQLLNGIDPLDKDATTAIQGKIDAAIMLRANALGGVDKATGLIITERHKTLAQVAERHETIDPVGFLQSLDRYQGMDGKTLDRLQVSAATRIDAAEKTGIETTNKFYELQMKVIEDERQQKLIWADEMARNRLLTNDHLRILRNTKTFKTPAEYDHLAEIIRQPPDQPINELVYRDVSANVHSLNPTYTAKDIRRFMADGAFGTKEGIPLIDRLRQHGERREDKDYQKRGVEYHTAMTEGERSLGMTSALESLDPQSKQLIDQFTQTMNARSEWVNGKENSRDVLYDILPRFLNAQKKDVRLRYETQMDLMPKDIVGIPPQPEPGRKAEEVWQAWHSAAAQKIETLPKNSDLYKRSRIQLKELSDARKRMIDNAVRMEESRSEGGGGSMRGRTPVPTP